MEVADRTEPTARAATSRGARRTAGSCCARSRRRPTRTSTPSRTSRATATSTRTRSGSTCDALRRRARARRRARPADDRQPQDGRPVRPVLARRSSSSRPRWARRSASSRARAALRVPRSRFVPVKTTNDLLVLRSDAYVLGEGRARRSWRPSATARRRSSTSTRRTTSCVRRLRRALPGGRRRRCVACDALSVDGDVTLRRRRGGARRGHGRGPGDGARRRGAGRRSR